MQTKEIMMQTYIGILILQQRHRTDSQVNNRESKVLRKGHLVDEKWHRVQVIISIVQIKVRISFIRSLAIVSK